MRHIVPFVGEQKVVRADDDTAQAKRATGKLIDDLIVTDEEESSWDDLVPKTHRSSKAPAKPQKASAQAPANKTNHPVSPARHPKVNDQLFSDVPELQWVSINNGKGLRVDGVGTMDKNLRSQWRQLLAEVEASNLTEFEINLSETPTLSLTGLGMLLMFKESSGASKMALCNCNKSVQNVLLWSGMEKYFVIEAPTGK